MKRDRRLRACRAFRRSAVAIVLTLAGVPTLSGQAVARSGLELELEAGPVWQSRNDVQIPNDASGTRFSLVTPLGRGPWQAARAYVSWHFNARHSVRALVAPLSVTGTGTAPGPIAFAGETFPGGSGLRGTYQFNSYRLTYRYRFRERERLRLWIGFTAKIRDAKIELAQGNVAARDTDVGFVPLLHFAADWRPTRRVHVLFDLDGLAGGPGRAFDVALKLAYDLNRHWCLSGGYRTVEGGADVRSVYAFAWLHYAVVSVTLRGAPGAPRGA
jgi:hypothetical protein